MKVPLPPDVPEDPVITCAHTLSPNGLHYIVTLSVKLSSYIAGEEVIDKISIIPDLIEYNDGGNVIDQDAGALVDFSLEVREGDTHTHCHLLSFLSVSVSRIIIQIWNLN